MESVEGKAPVNASGVVTGAAAIVLASIVLACAGFVFDTREQVTLLNEKVRKIELPHEDPAFVRLEGKLDGVVVEVERLRKTVESKR